MLLKFSFLIQHPHKTNETLLSSEVYVLLLLGVDERDKIVRFLNWK